MSRCEHDCGEVNRTKDSARTCQCLECKLWWCAHVHGYFLCPVCKEVCTPMSDMYDGVCEQCFDMREDDES